MGSDRGRSPADRPPSRDRRLLLLGFGSGAASMLVLDRLQRWFRSPPERALSLPPRSGPSARRATGSTMAGRGATTGSSGNSIGPAPAAPAADRFEPPPALAGAPEPPPAGHVFDVVIVGGRVIDPETGFDATADVGIDGSTITALSREPLAGSSVIDAAGSVVAPGFVDLLSYEPNPFGAWLKLADGVTTNLAMHGVSNYAAPFLDRYEDQSPIHFGGAFNHHFLRGFDLGLGIDDAPDAAHLARLETLARQQLAEGFAGISFSPEYSPGTTTEEMRRLATVAAELGHVCFFHVRHSDPDPPGTSLEAIDEVLGIAADTGAPIHIEHLTSTGGTFVMQEALARIEAARARGLDVTACAYPYDFWATFLGSQRFAAGWQARYRLSESDLQIAGTTTRLSRQTIADARRSNALVAALGSIPEHEVRAALGRSWVMVASDAIPTPERNNHPRGAGTFSRLIGRYVRELGVLGLVEGLAKLTVLPARRVEAMIPAMARKGRLRRGADADIVVFDPTLIADRATVADPAVASAGIDWVLVDGRVALRRGEPDRTVLAGRALRSGPPTG